MYHTYTLLMLDLAANLIILFMWMHQTIAYQRIRSESDKNFCDIAVIIKVEIFGKNSRPNVELSFVFFQ